MTFRGRLNSTHCTFRPLTPPAYRRYWIYLTVNLRHVQKRFAHCSFDLYNLCSSYERILSAFCKKRQTFSVEKELTDCERRLHFLIVFPHTDLWWANYFQWKLYTERSRGGISRVYKKRERQNIASVTFFYDGKKLALIWEPDALADMSLKNSVSLPNVHTKFPLFSLNQVKLKRTLLFKTRVPYNLVPFRKKQAELFHRRLCLLPQHRQFFQFSSAAVLMIIEANHACLTAMNGVFQLVLNKKQITCLSCRIQSIIHATSMILLDSEQSFFCS